MPSTSKDRSLNAKRERLFKPMKSAIMSEIHTIVFYELAASRCANRKAKTLFRKLVKEEKNHRKELERQCKSLMKYGVFCSPSSIKGTSLFLKDSLIGDSTKMQVEEVLSQSLKEWVECTGETSTLKKHLHETWFDSSALNIAVMLEKEAITQYQAEARKAQDKEVRSFFEWLSDWEKGHMDTLVSLDKAYREAFWSSSGFWPMPGATKQA